MMDRYSGDPRLVLTDNGATLDYRGGQPVMDQGLENCALLALLVDEGWAGNVFLPPEARVGSDYLERCRRPITLSGLADIESAAERALQPVKAFGEISAEASNPRGDRVLVTINLGPGGALALEREGGLWRAQALDPASRRLSS